MIISPSTPSSLIAESSSSPHLIQPATSSLSVVAQVVKGVALGVFAQFSLALCVAGVVGVLVVLERFQVVDQVKGAVVGGWRSLADRVQNLWRTLISGEEKPLDPALLQAAVAVYSTDRDASKLLRALNIFAQRGEPFSPSQIFSWAGRAEGELRERLQFTCNSRGEVIYVAQFPRRCEEREHERDLEESLQASWNLGERGGALPPPCREQEELAEQVQRGQLSLAQLGLSFSELKDLAPYLRFCHLAELPSEQQVELLPLLSPGLVEELWVQSPHVRAEHFPSLPNCRQLHCSLCTNLQALPELPRCLILDCADCVQLSQIPTLNACRELDCTGCTRLKKLPVMPECVRVVCSHCSQLKGVTRKLPRCRWLRGDHCEELSERIGSQLAPDALLIRGRRQGEMNWVIPRERVITEAKDFFMELGQSVFFKGAPLPRVTYTEADGSRSSAIDAQGVRRDFLSTVCTNLFGKKKEGLPPTRQLVLEEGLPLFQGREWEGECYRTLGHVMALCCAEGSAFHLGPLFSLNFYQALGALWRGEEWKAALFLFDLDKGMEQLVEGNSERASVRALDEAQFLLQEWEEEQGDDISDKGDLRVYFSRPEHGRMLKEALKAYFFEGEEKSRPLALIAQSMRAALESRRVELGHTEDPIWLKENVEGVLDWQSIWNQIEWHGRGLPGGEATRRFLKKWLEDSTEEQLSDFLWAVTSMRSLIPGKSLTVSLDFRDANRVPEAHTCFSTLNLSSNYGTQERFNERLEWLVAQAGAGFQMG